MHGKFGKNLLVPCAIFLMILIICQGLNLTKTTKMLGIRGIVEHSFQYVPL